MAQIRVTTHHNDNARTGANLAEMVLTPANVNAGTFGMLYTVPLDGQVYTQPLYISQLTIPGIGVHDVVYVATMNNTVYALDADNKGQELWRANFGAPVHPCDVEWHQNITQGSTVGILSTPVIDPATNTIYFVSRNEGSFDPAKCNWGANSKPTGVNQGIYTHYLNALDIRTGEPKFGSPVQISATYQSRDTPLTFNPNVHNQRAALTLANGRVYVAYASHDDLLLYHGWILSYNAANLVQDHTYSDTIAGRGGIWQAGNGLVVDPSGSIYASTGNGAFGPSAAGVIQTGNSFIKLSPTLGLLDYFTPSNSATLNSQDQDLGSSGLLLIPGSHLVFGGGKQGRVYLVDTTNMGHFDATTDQVRQEFQAIYGMGSQHIHGVPVYFNSDTLGPLLYVWGENDFLRAYRYDAARQLIDATPLAMSAMTAPETSAYGAMPGGFLSISANGKTNGILWASTPFRGSAAQATVTGVLHAFDALTLHELWNDKVNEVRDGIGNFAKFVPPTIADGRVFLPNFGAINSPDGSGSLVVYGLIPGGTANPSMLKDGIYLIVSRHSGDAVDDPASSKNAGTVQIQYPITLGANQKWKVTNVSLNVVSIINQSSNMALDVAGASTANSASVVQTPYTGSRSQQWRVSTDAGFFVLANVNSGQVLDVAHGAVTPRAELDQYPYKATAWQQWRFQ